MTDLQFSTLLAKLNGVEAQVNLLVTSVAILGSQRLDKRVTSLEITKAKMVGFVAAVGGLCGGGVAAVIGKLAQGL